MLNVAEGFSCNWNKILVLVTQKDIEDYTHIKYLLLVFAINEIKLIVTIKK